MSVASDLLTRLARTAVSELQDSVKSATERYQRCLDYLPQAAAEIALIEEAGLLTEEIASQISTYCVGSRWGRETLKIDRSALPAWRKIGKLKATGRDFDHTEEGTGKDFISVTVDVEGLKRFRLEYVREMPQGGRCQVRETVSTYRSLSCSLG